MTNPDTHMYAPVAVPVLGGGKDLGEHFIATPAVDTPSPEAQPYLEVVAPATLPEGYEFEAETNGHIFTVRVPVGGVEEGQKFSVPFPAGANGYSGSAIPRASVPVGAWKDGLCACFRHGLIHPVLWNAWCCKLILLGQVMHRLGLTWLGDEGTLAQTKATFRICLSITLVFFFVDYMCGVVSQSSLISINEDGDIVGSDIDGWGGLRYLLACSIGIFLIIVTAKTRKPIRSKFAIPETQ